MKRLIYIYCDNGSSGISDGEYDDSVVSQNSYAERFKDEGFYYLWRNLLERKVIDECLVFISSL